MDLSILMMVLLLTVLVFLFHVGGLERWLIVFLAMIVGAVFYINHPSGLEFGNAQKKANVSPVLLSQTSAELKEKNILIEFEIGNIWKVDRPNHRCLVDPGVWEQIPFDKKEQILQLIYTEEKTWWKLFDGMSGKLLGDVSSWGWKVYP